MQPPTFYRVAGFGADPIPGSGFIAVQLDPGEAQGPGRDNVRLSPHAVRSLGLKPGDVVAVRLEIISSEEKPA